ncbi:MAG: MarR family transcriptional regulator [Pseudomonadota bacterium]|nr:MarR family transcriptional regulator [Pseudomonadota bacterium]
MPQAINEFVDLMVESAALWRQHLGHRIRETGLSQAQWRVLAHINRSATPLTQGQLASRIGVEGATLVPLLDRLESDGWVQRQPHPEDRRCNILVLEAPALPVLQQAEAIADQLRRELLGNVNTKLLQDCIQVFRHIKESVESLPQQKP